MLDLMTEGALGTLGAEEGEVLDVFGARLVVKADPAELGFLLAEHSVPPGYFVPPHVHAEDHEAFFMLEGEMTLLSGSSEIRLCTGGTVRLPAGLRHGFRNDTDTPARFLLAVSPGIQAVEMFRHFNRAGSAAPGGLAPPQIVAICKQYGVVMG